MPEHTPSPTPERAIYGFVLYLAAYVLLVIYLLWAFVPDEWLHAVGLTYWPQKYWALAAPVYAIIAGGFILFMYVSYNFVITKPLDSINTITDQYAKRVNTENLPKGAIPPIGDLHISDVNRHLYMR